MDISNRLHSRRKTLNLTLREAADKSGTTASTWLKWERGEIKTLKVNKIEGIAKALGVSPAWLMGWEEDPRNFANIEPSKEPDDTEIMIEAFDDSLIGIGITPGSTIYAVTDEAPQNGDYVVAIFRGDTIIRRYYDRGDYIEFRSENPSYETLFAESKDFKTTFICGKVVSYLRKL